MEAERNDASLDMLSDLRTFLLAAGAAPMFTVNLEIESLLREFLPLATDSPPPLLLGRWPPAATNADSSDGDRYADDDEDEQFESEKL